MHRNPPPLPHALLAAMETAFAEAFASGKISTGVSIAEVAKAAPEAPVTSPNPRIAPRRPGAEEGGA